MRRFIAGAAVVAAASAALCFGGTASAATPYTRVGPPVTGEACVGGGGMVQEQTSRFVCVGGSNSGFLITGDPTITAGDCVAAGGQVEPFAPGYPYDDCFGGYNNGYPIAS